MSQRKVKIFRNVDVKNEKIICIPLSNNDESEYYSFLRKCHINGLRQIIVTSELMMKIIRFLVIERNLKISSICFMEDDDDLDKEIEALIRQSQHAPEYFKVLLDKLNFLSENSSIEIQKVSFKGRNSKKQAVQLFIQSNGILSVDDTNFDSITKEMSDLIKGCLF